MGYKLSVVVPVYNVEEYLEQCIKSIIGQTYVELELILVDDGSTDRSGMICDQYAKQDSRVKVIHKENAGHTSARKQGVKMASGDYITFVDSDDWLDLEAYEVVFAKIQNTEPEIIAFGNKKNFGGTVVERNEILQEGFYTKLDIARMLEVFYSDDEIAMNHILLGNIWNKFFKAELVRYNLEKVSESIVRGEDIALLVPCLIEAQSVYVVHYCPYHYRVRESSIMHTSVSSNYLNVKLVHLRIEEALYINGLSEDSRYKKMALSYSYYVMLLNDIRHYVHSLSDLYEEIATHQNIIVYGKGVYGNAIIDLARQYGECKIIDSIDKTCVEDIHQYTLASYDYILIAITNAEFVRDAIEVLMSHGVPIERILYLKNKDLKESIFLSD